MNGPGEVNNRTQVQVPFDQNETVFLNKQNPNVYNIALATLKTGTALDVRKFLGGVKNQFLRVRAEGAVTLLYNAGGNGSIITNSGANKLLSPLIIYEFTYVDELWVEVVDSGISSGLNLTLNNSNAGASSPAIFNGTAPVTVSANTIGAVSLGSFVTLGDAEWVQLSGSYANPSWITSLDWSKITGAPSFGTVTSVGGTGTVSGLTLTGLVTAAGNLTLGGAISITASQVSDFAGATAATASVTANSAKITNATHTGEVTGSAALTIAAAAVTYAKIQNLAANTFLANVTGSAASAQEILTSRIPLFASAITGAPSGSTYLRGDGAWAAVSGSGDVVGPASATDNAVVRFDLATGKLVQNSVALLTDAGHLYGIPKLHIGGSAPDINVALYVTAGVTATGLNARAIWVRSALTAASNSDDLFALHVNPDPLVLGAFFGLEWFGVTVKAPTLSSGTLDAAYAFYASSIPAGSNRYGLYVEDITGGSQNFAIRTGLGRVQFGGEVSVGNVTPSVTTQLLFAAGATGVSPLRIPHGVAPTSPVNGDVWTTTAGVFARINAITVGPLGSNVVFVPTTSNIAINSVTDVTIVTRVVAGVAVGDQVVVEAHFTILNDSAATRVYVITLDFDSLFDVEFTTAALVNSATLMHPFYLRACLDVRSASLSFAVFSCEGQLAAGIASGTDTTMAATHLRAMGWGTSAVDISGAAIIDLKIRSAAATATQTFRLHQFRITKDTPT